MYVFMDIGCRECGDSSRLVMLSDDLDAVKAKWAEETAGMVGGSPPFEVRNPDYGNEWPDNVIALDGGGSYAWVVYEVRP